VPIDAAGDAATPLRHQIGLALCALCERPPDLTPHAWSGRPERAPVLTLPFATRSGHRGDTRAPY